MNEKNHPKRNIVLLALLITTTGFSTAYADHGGSGGGSGCGGDCTPPTLGIDEYNNIRVEEGLSINSVPFSVGSYSQTIPTQILNINEKNKIVLQIFENQGPQNVIHAELHFATYEKLISGVWVEQSVASLVWHNDYGDEVIGIYDDENILENITINAKNEDGFKIISFEFEPTVTLDKSTLMTNVWDENKNAVRNYFNDAIQVTGPNNSGLSSEYDNDSQAAVIPQWIKNSAKWWAEGEISDPNFLGGIEYMIKTKVIDVQTTDNEENNSDDVDSTDIPYWIKNNAKWWGEDLISDEQFVSGLQFLIKNGIIST